MAINPITMNGMMSRTQDMSIIKQNEDSKGATNQNHFQVQFHKEVADHTTKVSKPDQSETERQRKDAKDKGDNEYQGDGGRRRRKEQEKDGKVIVRGYGSFDMKI